MNQVSNFKKSNFYILLVCNYWTIVSFLEMVFLIILTSIIYKYFNNCHVIFYIIQFVLGVIYFIYSNIGMIQNYPLRKKIYLDLVESIENNKPFKRSMIYAMMMTRCEKHIVKILEKNYKIKLT